MKRYETYLGGNGKVHLSLDGTYQTASPPASEYTNAGEQPATELSRAPAAVCGGYSLSEGHAPATQQQRGDDVMWMGDRKLEAPE